MLPAEWEPRALAAEARVAELEARVVELETELATLRKRPALGRKANAPKTEDQRLVSRACKKLVVSRAQLAERLGIGRENRAMLSRPLTPALRQAIEALTAAALGASRSG